MPQFAYSAINAQGNELSGEIHAADLSSARDVLLNGGLLAERIAEIKASAGSEKKKSGGMFQKKVQPKSLQVFSRQFATMIEAGLSVVTALVILEEQTDDEALGGRHRRRPRAGRDGRAPLGGDGAPPGRLQPPLHRDGRGRRGCRRARHGPRPRRDPDREGAEDQAPGEGRDDLPDRRARVRDARDDRHADVPRPGLRQHLRSARRRAADADAVRDARVERAPQPADPGPAGSRRCLLLGDRDRWLLLVPPLEEDRARPRRSGTSSS